MYKIYKSLTKNGVQIYYSAKLNYDENHVSFTARIYAYFVSGDGVRSNLR
jgi:hypothetical protein